MTVRQAQQVFQLGNAQSDHQLGIPDWSFPRRGTPNKVLLATSRVLRGRVRFISELPSTNRIAYHVLIQQPELVPATPKSPVVFQDLGHVERGSTDDHTIRWRATNLPHIIGSWIEIDGASSKAMDAEILFYDEDDDATRDKPKNALITNVQSFQTTGFATTSYWSESLWSSWEPKTI